MQKVENNNAHPAQDANKPGSQALAFLLGVFFFLFFFLFFFFMRGKADKKALSRFQPTTPAESIRYERWCCAIARLHTTHAESNTGRLFWLDDNNTGSSACPLDHRRIPPRSSPVKLVVVGLTYMGQGSRPVSGLFARTGRGLG